MDRRDPPMPAAPEPSAIHRAIDQTATALLEVQLLRQRLTNHDEISEGLHRVEGTLHTLGSLLQRIRDERDSDQPAQS